MTKHTPGPWYIGERCDDDNTLAIRNDRKSSPLAWVSPRPHYNNTQAANATLIAAAPDGLAANKAALSAILVAEQLGEIYPDTFAETKATLRAAIAKAESN